MKKIKIALLLLIAVFSNAAFSQNCKADVPPMTIEELVNMYPYAFEGRVLKIDSSFYADGATAIATAYQVLILKKFKGEFQSDTIELVMLGGTVRSNINEWNTQQNAIQLKPDDEGVFFGGITGIIVTGIHVPHSYFAVEYKKTCGKKDIDKDIYWPLEKATGHKLIYVHPKLCKIQGTQTSLAQSSSIDPKDIPKGEGMWGGIPINDLVNQADLILEGKVLSDSVIFVSPPGDIFTAHKVLVLKQFKGTFKSDTIEVFNRGGKMFLDNSWQGMDKSFANKGDIGIFMVSTSLNKTYFRIDDPDFYYILYGEGTGFVKVCDKKDVVKEVYAPLEKAIGRKHIDIHLNDCKAQEVQKKSPSQTLNSLKGDTPVFNAIYYAFENVQPHAGSISFKVFSSVSADALFSQGNVICYYDTAQFGSHIIANGKLNAHLSTNLDPNVYSLNLQDIGPGTVSMAITSTGTASTYDSLSPIPKEILLCSLIDSPMATGINAASMGFDSAGMQNGSTYFNVNSNLQEFFNYVYTGGSLYSASSAQSIDYALANFVVDNVGNKVSFNIVASGSTQFSDGSVVISYNDLAFGSSIASTVGSSGDAAHSVAVSDFSTNKLQVDIFSSNGQTSFTSLPATLASITIPFSSPGCSQTAGIAADNAATSSLTSDYFDPTDTVTPIHTYSGVSATGSFNDVLCPPQSPHVDYISPDCINAGSFDILTINGSHFGTDTGTVYFNNADASGTFFAAERQDIRLWTDAQIQILVPSYPNTAGGGQFYIVTATGLDNIPDNTNVSIGYANINGRNNDNSAEYIYLPSTPFVFQLSPNLWSVPGALKSIRHALADINCQTGVNFQVDTTGPSTATSSVQNDGVNLISIQPAASLPATVLAGTLLNSRRISCYHSSAQYNNNSAYQTDIDIEIKDIPTGGTWLWSDSISPTASQFDFATIILHELGHGAQLTHTLYASRASGNVMYPSYPKGFAQRSFASDNNNVLGILHVLTTGQAIAALGCNAAATQVFPAACPTIAPSACIPYFFLGIAEAYGLNSFHATLYPNPYQDNTVVHVDVSQFSDLTVTVYDLLGQPVFQKSIQTDSSVDVSLSDLHINSGLYLIEVSDGRQKSILKLTKF